MLLDKVFFVEDEIIHGKDHASGITDRDSVGTDLSVRLFKAILQALIPLFVGMFVYKEETSRVTSIALVGRTSISLSMLRR